jgi:hypothetical protein
VHVTPLARKLLDGGSHAARLPQHAQDEGEPSVLSYGSWGRGRARAKAEPRLVLQICSHCAGKVRPSMLLLVRLPSPVLLLFLWFVCQIRRVLMVRERNSYCLFIFSFVVRKNIA